MSEKKIYAVIVSINNYPTAPLKGCINDGMNVEKLLVKHFGDRAIIKKLFDANATRLAVVDAFSHYEAAGPNDTCLFYFSGHGSKMRAHSSFWRQQIDKKHETLVCFDSVPREKHGNRDLLDKELSYLIYNATLKNEPHFLAIIDSCHSGEVTRFDGEIEEHIEKYVRERAHPEDENITYDLNGLEGIDSFEQGADNQLIAPVGPYVVISAANKEQKAKEVFEEGQYRGAFTHALLKSIENAGLNLPYGDLMNRINTRVKFLIKEQTPQIDYPKLKNAAHTPFLNLEPDDFNPNFEIYFNHDLQKWIFNRGLFDGYTIDQTIIALEEMPTQKLSIDSIHPDYMIVNVPNDLKKKQFYKAIVIQKGVQKVKLSFTGSTQLENARKIIEKFRTYSSDIFSVETDPNQASYHISLRKNQFALFALNNDEQLIPFLAYHPNQIEDVIHKVETVFKWVRTKDLDNSQSYISYNDLEFSFYRLAKAGDYSDQGPAETIADIYSPIELPYLENGGNYHPPAFRMKIKNKSPRNLWLSTLFLGNDYSVSNVLMRSKEVAPGQEVWLENIMGAYPTNTIPVKMKDEFYNRGHKSVLDILKILVSTEQLNTDKFNQRGIELDYEETTRSLFLERSAVGHSDWRAFDFLLEVQRP